jgi:amidase
MPDHNSALVDLLLDAGAVLYCKTNLPQTMMVSYTYTTETVLSNTI